MGGAVKKFRKKGRRGRGNLVPLTQVPREEAVKKVSQKPRGKGGESRAGVWRTNPL